MRIVKIKQTKKSLRLNFDADRADVALSDMFRATMPEQRYLIAYKKSSFWKSVIAPLLKQTNFFNAIPHEELTYQTLWALTAYSGRSTIESKNKEMKISTSSALITTTGVYLPGTKSVNFELQKS